MDVTIGIVDEGFGPPSYTPHLTLIHRSSDCQNGEQHGAIVAIVLGGDTSYPGLGVLPGIRLYAYEIPCYGATVSDLVSAINQLVRLQVAVINISLSLGRDDPRLRASVLDAVSQGVTIVAASGNTSGEAYQYPASYAIPGVIAVGALGQDFNVLPSTTVNDRVDVFATGDAMSAGYRDGRWTVTSFDGTSVAAPFVTALVALLKAQDPSLTPGQIEQHIRATATAYMGRWGSDQVLIRAIDFDRALTNTGHFVQGG